jgi:hypothetical protein
VTAVATEAATAAATTAGPGTAAGGTTSKWLPNPATESAARSFPADSG